MRFKVGDHVWYAYKATDEYPGADALRVARGKITAGPYAGPLPWIRGRYKIDDYAWFAEGDLYPVESAPGV